MSASDELRMIAVAQAGGGILIALAAAGFVGMTGFAGVVGFGGAVGFDGTVGFAVLAVLAGTCAVALPQWHFARRVRRLLDGRDGVRRGAF
ncbi:MAG: hypothetical protein ACR2P5_04530, partial [Gammaproteobacteria bacterium]